MNIEKHNIFLRETKKVLPYKSSGFGPRNYPDRIDPKEHARKIRQELQDSISYSLTSKQVAAIRKKEGIYLEFSGAKEKDLKLESLESIKQGIRLLNVQYDEGVIKATIFVPEGKESYFLSRIDDYANSIDEDNKRKNPKNNDLVRSIEAVQSAVIESFWTDKKKFIPEKTECWCEVWLRCTDNDKSEINDSFTDCCKKLGILCNEKQFIYFPERIVRIASVNRQALSKLIQMYSNIAELRRVPEIATFFEDMSGIEQKEWSNELLERTKYIESNATICILDTGIAMNHPLLKDAITKSSVQAVDKTWGTDDHDGHGTQMAGLAVYNDLQDQLEKVGSLIEIPQKLESVKILPPRGKNDKELYGAITEQAVALAEIENPSADRSICMAVTAPDDDSDTGKPSSWSGAIDKMISGAEDDTKRLMFISGGNVNPYEYERISYPKANTLHSVENPAQSWNAISVGAYSSKIEIRDKCFKGFSPIADVDELSPYSTTSVLWDRKWPIKPEILFEGGNIATNGHDYSNCSDLSLLTTSRDYLKHPFSTFCATSAATAQAAWMAAQLYAEYPGIWPETVRALIIHSAEWSPKMIQQFCKDDRKTTGRKNLLRTCGYGVPNLNTAIQCMNNFINLIIQGELQPYIREKSGQPKMNEMDLHTIPWPRDVLQELGDQKVKLRVTLSYYIEPGPGEIGWKDRYRYSSCGLRFDVINRDEDIKDFEKRVNKAMRGDDAKDAGDGTSGSDRWYLGSDNRDVGSIHSDYMYLSAVEMCDMNCVAVYPVGGWWKERAYLEKYNKKIRYALVVSLSTEKVDTDFYTPIITQITNSISITT